MTALHDVVGWLDSVLEPRKFDDVANNGVQVARRGSAVRLVAFGVDASADFIDKCAEAGAGLAVVHHGISWGGGIKRIDGGIYEVVKRALDADIAIYASHLPLDAHPLYGNNAGIARLLGLAGLEKAFSYHGNLIGLTGTAQGNATHFIGNIAIKVVAGEKVGVCSGGAGSFAEEAVRLGCGLFVTGEADWGEKVAARNAGAKMVCAGHYETETFGVKALQEALAQAMDVETVFL